jgi:hypothetical protein
MRCQVPIRSEQFAGGDSVSVGAYTLADMIQSPHFPLTNVLRGRLAERILTVVLLERGGYRVTRLGIEELFDEVKYLDWEQYLSLGLPEQLRTLPDLLVTDAGVTRANLIELKYRRLFDKETAEELLRTLTYQRKFWPPSFAVIIVGKSSWSDDARFHQDYIRVIPPDETALLKGPRGDDIPTDEPEAMHALVTTPDAHQPISFPRFRAFRQAR